MKFIKENGAPKRVLDSYKAFKQLYQEKIKDSLEEEDKKDTGKISHAVKEAYDKISKKEKVEVERLISKDKKRYEQE